MLIFFTCYIIFKTIDNTDQKPFQTDIGVPINDFYTALKRKTEEETKNQTKQTTKHTNT